jgi:cobalt/nickel transport protein
VEPEPYWEAAENAFIIHYTKAVVTAFGDDEGWGRQGRGTWRCYMG